MSISKSKICTIFTVSVEDHNQMEPASDAMWDLAYYSLEQAKRVIEADAREYRQSLVNEGDTDLVGVALPEWSESDDRSKAWTLADDIAGRSWYVQGALLS